MTPTKPQSEEATKTPPYHYGTGRRKSAIARVRIFAGSGKFMVNEHEQETPPAITSALELVGKQNDLDISAFVSGGGKEGQIGAIRHGLARALIEMDADLRTTLKKAGLLTRDPREKEREKPGLHGARRGPQFSKR